MITVNTLQMFQRFFTVLLFSGIVLICNAQEDQLALIRQLNAASGNDQTALKALLEDTRQPQLVQTIYTYAKDTLSKGQKGTVALIRKLEPKIRDKKQRQDLVHALVEVMWNDKTASIQALNAMKAFSRGDFDQSAKDELIAFLGKDSEGRQEAILLIGFIGTSSDIAYLKNAAQYSKLSKIEKYKLKLALVRLNDPETVSVFMDELSQRKFDDNVVINVLPDLVYTHHPEVYKKLVAELENETPLCYSANNDSPEKILCAYRIIEVLPKVITGFPVKLDKYGEIAGSYEEALAAARKWAAANTSFTIQPDNF